MALTINVYDVDGNVRVVTKYNEHVYSCELTKAMKDSYLFHVRKAVFNVLYKNVASGKLISVDKHRELTTQVTNLIDSDDMICDMIDTATESAVKLANSL